jgi:hypothetical protein
MRNITVISACWNRGERDKLPESFASLSTRELKMDMEQGMKGVEVSAMNLQIA